MATEIELKLAVSAADARGLPLHPLLQGVPSQTRRLVNTYWDTPGLDLSAHGLVVRLRQIGRGWWCTVKAADASGGLSRSEWEAPTHPGQVDVAHVDDAELRGFLEATQPSLVPVFTTAFRRTTWEVGVGRSRVEVALDRGEVRSGDRRTPIRELELELLSGEVTDLFELAAALSDRHPLRPAPWTKAERGYDLFLDRPLAPRRARPIHLDDRWTAIQAFRTVALACLDQFQRNAPGLGLADPEFVHQGRVALRRLRTALKLFAPALPEGFVATWGAAWRDLAGSLGAARDWDVFLAETLPPIAGRFPTDPGVRRLASEGRRRARLARQQIGTRLAAPETARLLLGFTAAVHALPDAPSDLAAFARDSLRVRARRVHKLATRHAELGPEDRHRMRIRFKDLRYALEFFAPILPKKRVKPHLRALSGLTDQLGRLNDQVTTERLVDEALAGRPPGAVHGWVTGRHELLLEELPAAIEAFLEADTPWR